MRLKSTVLACLLVPAWLCGGMVSAEDSLSRLVREFNAADDELYTNAIDNASAEAYLRKNVPYFECPDETIVRAYWFRWWTFRKHLRKCPDGTRVITEFLPNVGWSGKYNTISCPLGHHIRESRWIGDGSWAESHLAFMVREGNVTGPKSYVNWPARSAAELEAVTGRRIVDARFLDDLVRHHEAWERGWRFYRYDIGLTNGLFRVVDDREGMEYSPGEYGYRPLINAAFAANARAIAAFAVREGRKDLSLSFAEKARILETNLRNRLWNGKVGFFTAVLNDGRHSPVRELTGFTPWYFGVAPTSCGTAWRLAVDQNCFLGRWGLTTVDRSNPAFKLDYVGHECKWNGPVWPYATSMTLSGLADYLQSGGDAVDRESFFRLLKQYAASHVRRTDDGRLIDWIDENQNPDDGDWISRTMILKNEKKRRTFPRERGKDYNHSTFCDIVIGGLVGVRPGMNGLFEVRPLAPGSWPWFRLSNLHYHGRVYSISYDKDGDHYGNGRGLIVREERTEVR